MSRRNNKWSELENIIKKMPLNVCCMMIIPEFGFSWREVSKAIRKSRLPMHSSSVARVIRTALAKSLPPEELDDLLGRLRLKSVAVTQNRTWHVIHLLDPFLEEPITDLLHTLPHRVLTALKDVKRKGMRPVVQTLMFEDLMYMSIQFVSAANESSVLYVATPPGQPVAVVSSVSAGKLLNACAKGLGYDSYNCADLYGKHLPSLLRIADPSWNAEADHLTELPVYDPRPVVTSNGIDYTNRAYDEEYIDRIIGPDPPLLTELNIKTSKKFFDITKLNKTINLSVTLKSEDVSKSLRQWALMGAITPTSDLFHIFRRVKSNRIQYQNEDSD